MLNYKHPIKTYIYYKATWLYDRFDLEFFGWIRDITYNEDLYE